MSAGAAAAASAAAAGHRMIKGDGPPHWKDMVIALLITIGVGGLGLLIVLGIAYLFGL